MYGQDVRTDMLEKQTISSLNFVYLMEGTDVLDLDPPSRTSQKG